jgi:hypothetical protein
MDEGRPYQLGRDPACDFVIDDDRVSRRHSEFAALAGSWRLRDLGSKNGVAVGGRAVVEAELREASWISLGGLPLRFEPLTDAALRHHRASVERRRRHTLDLTRSPQSPAGDPPLAAGQRARDSLAALLESARAAAEAERASLFTLDDQGQPRLAAATSEAGDGRPRSSPAFTGSRGALEQVLANGRAVVVADVAHAASLGARQSVRGQGIMALVCLPLRAQGRLVGLLYADRRTPGRVFTDLDVELLGTVADHLGLALASARLSSELEAIAGALRTAGARPKSQ